MANDTTKIKAVRTENVIAQTVREGQPELLVVNKGLRNLTNPDLFAWHLGVAMRAKAVDANGMPTAEEIAIVNEVSEKIVAFMLESRTEHGAPNALFFAQSTWNGIREVIFRVHDAAAAIKLLGKRTYDKWERDWEFKIVEDPRWEMVAPITNLLAAADDDRPLR
jgi:hypothetical protein